MANVKISALAELTTPVTGDYLVIVDSSAGTTKKITPTNLGKAITLISDADGDTLVQAEESGDEDILRFDTGGTERGRIDANGLQFTKGVFGSTSLAGDGTLHVQTSAVAEGASAPTAADDVVVESDANVGIAFLSPNDSTFWLTVGDSDDNVIAGLRYTHTDDILALFSADTFVAYLDENGMTLPVQPAFLVRPASNQENIATGGVTVVFGTEITDQGSDFAANTFTAPTDGNYQLNLIIKFTGIDTAASAISINIVTSNRSYSFDIDPDTHFVSDGASSFAFSVLADMDASDTAYVTVFQTGGAAQMDIVATQTFFSGHLAC